MLIGRFIYYYIEIQEVTLFNLIMTGVEASLAFVLTLIFLQSIPLFSIIETETNTKNRRNRLFNYSARFDDDRYDWMDRLKTLKCLIFFPGILC